MDESVGKFCKTLSSFCNHLQTSCDNLKQSADRRPIPLDSASTTFVQCLNRKVNSAAADLNLLESMSCDTVSFEELLGHCYQVYHHNQVHLVALQEHLASTSDYIPPPDDTDEDLDDEDRDLEDYSCMNLEFPEDPLLDDSPSLKSFGLSDACLATIASEGAAEDGFLDEENCPPSVMLSQGAKREMVDDPKPAKCDRLPIEVSKVDYDNLPAQIKILASWENIAAAVEKINASLAMRSPKPDRLHQDDIASLGLGDKARSYLLMLLKMNRMAVEVVDGAICYRML